MKISFWTHLLKEISPYIPFQCVHFEPVRNLALPGAQTSLYQWLDPWIWLSIICVVISFSLSLPLMKYKPISIQTHKACAYTLAIVNNLFFIDGWGVGTIPAFIHSRNLISSSCPGVQNGPYFWLMALLLMPAILPSLCTIDFGFYLLLWVLYSFLLYGDFFFLGYFKHEKFSINVVVLEQKGI